MCLIGRAPGWNSTLDALDDLRRLREAHDIIRRWKEDGYPSIFQPSPYRGACPLVQPGGESVGSQPEPDPDAR